MKIGIILYSHSGNTLSVGERLKEALLKQGHEVSLERIKASDEDPQSKMPPQLTGIPDPSPYDEIILGAPVQAFSLNPIMKAYLEIVHDLKGKEIACYVTEQLPKAWMGGNRAIRQIKQMVRAKNGIISDSAVINWSNKKQEEQINEMVARFSR